MTSPDQSTMGGAACLGAADRLGEVAAQLAEAACRALDGDADSVRTRISRALALLRGEHGADGSARRSSSSLPKQMPRGGLAAWQARRLAAHIDAKLAERILTEELAQLAGLSTGHFCRAFKRTFGTPAHAYLMRRRIEFAKGVMLKTQLSLSEIALACGLSDQAHFSRAFRRIVGETPHAWRRARRAALTNAPASRIDVAVTP